jgi:hypothetical protein
MIIQIYNGTTNRIKKTNLSEAVGEKILTLIEGGEFKVGSKREALGGRV